MLKLVINNTEVDLPPNVQLDLNIRGNLFIDGNSNQGSFTYNITIPATPNNMRVFNHPHRLHKRKRDVLGFNGYIHLSSNVQMPALAKIVEANSDTYEIVIGVGNGLFYANFKDKELRSLDFGRYDLFGVELYSFSYTNPYYPYTPDVSPFALFPVHNKSFFKAMEESVDAGLYVSVEWQNMFNSTQFGGGTYGWSVITPFYYLHWVIERMFKETGYKVGYNVFYDNVEMRNWCLFNVTDCAFENTDVPTQERWSIAALHLPKMKIGDFVSALEKRFNVRFIFSLLTNEVNIVSFAQVANTAKKFKFAIKKNPDILYQETPTGYKFTEKEPENDEAYKRYNTTTNIISGNVAVFDAVALFTDLPAPTVLYLDKVFYVESTNTYYRCYAVGGIPVVYGWQAAYNFESELTIGENPEEIETECSSLPMDMVLWRGEPNWSLNNLADAIYCPVVDMKGSITSYKNNHFRVEPVDAGLRILAARGKNVSKLGEMVDFGSSDIYMDQDNTIWPDAKYSLHWKTRRKDNAGQWVESGIYDMFYKDYVQYRGSAHKIKFTARLQVFELAHLSFMQLWRAAQLDTVPDSFVASINDKGVINAEFEAFIL